jgi:DNA-directed RNA polymerase subunit alpha
MEIVLARGQGYVSAERNKQTVLEKSADRHHSGRQHLYPVLKVNYQVENTAWNR